MNKIKDILTKTINKNNIQKTKQNKTKRKK